VKPYLDKSNGPKGNTEGRRKMTDEEKAYIAGFLDGDGSIMAQLVFRKDYKLGYQVRTSVVFYQKTNHQDFLLWLKEQLGYGYVRMRNDGMSEYTIVGFREVDHVLTLLCPFLRLKKDLARDVLRIIKSHPVQRKMTAPKLVSLSKLVDKTASFNYSKKRTITTATVVTFLSTTGKYVPVETESALNQQTR
jgi:hypothetical protein